MVALSVLLLPSVSPPEEKDLEVLGLVSTDVVKLHWSGHSFQQKIRRKKESKTWDWDAILALEFGGFVFQI